MELNDEMATLKEIKERGFIDVKDDINFGTHREVMKLFGKDRINQMLSFFPHPHEEGVHIWFPVFYQDDKNDWENTWDKTKETAFERRKEDNAAYLEEQFDAPERHTRIMFAKLQASRGTFYKFQGIYKFDPELSRTAKKGAYRRVATTAKLYPLE